MVSLGTTPLSCLRVRLSLRVHKSERGSRLFARDLECECDDLAFRPFAAGSVYSISLWMRSDRLYFRPHGTSGQDMRPFWSREHLIHILCLISSLIDSRILFGQQDRTDRQLPTLQAFKLTGRSQLVSLYAGRATSLV